MATATPTATPVLTPAAAGAGFIAALEEATLVGNVVNVTFSVTDGQGVPLQPVLTAGQTDNQARVRFTTAYLVQYNGGGDVGNLFYKYVNVVNPNTPAMDSKGTITPIDPSIGLYKFTFSVSMPSDYAQSQTISVGMQANRNYKTNAYRFNDVFDFVPAGGEPTIWEDVTTPQCNQCHNPLIAHGSRYEVRLCKLCHTQGAAAPNGDLINFKLMIHKIHAGVDLPSVNLGPVGTQYAVNNTVFAKKQADGTITGVAFPRTLESCTYCHANAPTADYWYQKPAQQACATCHDDVNPGNTVLVTPNGNLEPGTNHFSDLGFPDGQCTLCHVPQMSKEFDISVPGAHVIPETSTQLKGVNIALTGITNNKAGQVPTISFKMTQDDGTVYTDLSVFNRVGFAIAGPTTDYAQVFTPTAVGGGSSGTLVGPDADGVFQYTPTAASGIPATAVGTWTVGAEARQTVNLVVPSGSSPRVVNEAAVNPVLSFVVDNSKLLARRAVVDMNLCGKCHGQFSVDFSIHGNLRNQAQYCVLCHNPNNSDFARRKSAVAADPTTDPVDATINFRVMIHKIHRGENLAQQPYVIYGFGAPPANYTANNFGDVLFPGNLQVCTTCHLPSTYLLPPYPGQPTFPTSAWSALPTQLSHVGSGGTLVIDGYQPPIQSVCLACHDSDAAITHALTNTDGQEEACTICHAEGRVAAVSAVHAVQ